MTTQIAKPPPATSVAAVDSAAKTNASTDAGSAPDAVYWLDADGPGLPITLDLRPLLGGKMLADFDVDCIEAFLAANELYQLEYNDIGELVVMPPLYMPAGDAETELLADTKIWQRLNGGMAPSSSAVFRIPGLGGRGPDASWVSPERLATLDAEQRRTGQICPDFVAEIRSPSNSLTYLQRKMAEYIANGARLGWLIDPRNRRVTIYRVGGEVETLEDPEVLSGEDVMPGFEFHVRELIFDAAQ